MWVFINHIWGILDLYVRQYSLPPSSKPSMWDYLLGEWCSPLQLSSETYRFNAKEHQSWSGGFSLTETLFVDFFPSVFHQFLCLWKKMLMCSTLISSTVLWSENLVKNVGVLFCHSLILEYQCSLEVYSAAAENIQCTLLFQLNYCNVELFFVVLGRMAHCQ